MFPTNWKAALLTVIIASAAVVTVAQYRKGAAAQDRLDCVAGWLEKARTLHDAQMKDASNFTGESMQKLMDSIARAYDCATKEPSHLIAPGSGAFGEHGVQPH